MNAPTRIATKLDPARTAKTGARSNPSWELLPDEPFDPDRGGGSGRWLRRITVLGLVGLGAAWGVWGEPARWREWMPEVVVEQVSALVSNAARGGTPSSAASPQQQPSPNRIPVDGQGAEVRPSLELRADATLLTTEPDAGDKPNVLNKSSEASAGAGSPAPSIGSAYSAPDAGADPLAKRAASVGLHPDISRALLKRLSDADFQNAGAAIHKAVAETADDGIFIWPRQRKPELALFQVYFVPGAGPDCRRYVVTITKDAWNTTALPMERCGVKPVRSKSG